MYAAPVIAPILALWLGVNAPAPVVKAKKPRVREVVVLAAAAQESNEPAFVLLCVVEGKLREGGACRPPLLGTKARHPGEAEHTVGRTLTARPCELARRTRPAVALEPPAPRGPFVAVWPADDAAQLVPAEALPTRIPDAPMLEALGAAVQGTPVIDQSLVVDLDHDGKDDRLVAVRKKDGGAQLIVFPGDAPQTWRALPVPSGARVVRVIARSDLDKNQQDELFLFAQLEGGWELSVISADQEAPLSSLVCEPK